MTEPVEAQIRRTDADGYLTLTFIRDGKLNAVTEAMLDVMRRAVRDLGDDESIRALLIRAEGYYFTAGKGHRRVGHLLELGRCAPARVPPAA